MFEEKCLNKCLEEGLKDLEEKYVCTHKYIEVVCKIVDALSKATINNKIEDKLKNLKAKVEL